MMGSVALDPTKEFTQVPCTQHTPSMIKLPPIVVVSQHLSSPYSLPSLNSIADSTLSAQPANQEKRNSKSKSHDTELSRQRNRMHQARYKVRQANKVTDLKNSIVALKEEVQELKIQRQLVMSRAPEAQTKWSVVAEYFRLFRNGLGGSGVLENAEMQLHGPVASHVQQRFLQSTMSNDVVGVIGNGIEALLENWKMISLCHPDIDIQLVRLENGPADSLVAITRGRATFTEDTLRFAFPHLTDEGDARNWSPVARRLLGQSLVISGCTTALWDKEARRVVSIQYIADVLTPMMQLLGSLEDVSRVFSNATLDPGSRFDV